MESDQLLIPSQFSYRKGLGTCDALLTLYHNLQVALDRGVEGRIIQLDFSAAFDRASHWALLYRLRSMDVGKQFLFIVSEFLSDRRQRVRLKHLKHLKQF